MQYVFNNLPWIVPSETERIKRIYQDLGSIRYAKRDTVLKFPGDENKLFYIKKGLCFAYVNTFDHRLLTIGVLLPGRAVGDMTVVSGERVNMTLVAKRNTQVLAVNPDEFRSRITSDTSLTMEFAKTILAKRNCHMEGLIANLTMPLEERLKVFFLAGVLAEKCSMGEDVIELPINLTNEDLASITCSTRVSVSRILSKWVKEGLLFKRGSHNHGVKKELFNNLERKNGWAG